MQEFGNNKGNVAYLDDRGATAMETINLSAQQKESLFNSMKQGILLHLKTKGFLEERELYRLSKHCSAISLESNELVRYNTTTDDLGGECNE